MAGARRFRVGIYGLLCVWLSACGGSSPTSPNSDTLAVRAGLQLVNIHGYGISSNPDFPPCMPFGVPYAGTGLYTSLRLAKEGNDWVARSLSQEQGNLVISFRSNGVTDVVGAHVTGVATGSQVDTGYPGIASAHGIRMFIDGTAEVSGSVPLSWSFLTGRMVGTFRFVDDQGKTGTCTAVYWDLQPIF